MVSSVEIIWFDDASQMLDMLQFWLRRQETQQQHFKQKGLATVKKTTENVLWLGT